MAKIKLQGHASGSGIITLTAPNTSTDRTITLPDATATIATTTDVAARLPSITDGGNATAMTIDSSENVVFTGEVQTSKVIPSSNIHLNLFGGSSDGQIKCYTNSTLRLQITADGRGLSQFTAKAWAQFAGDGTAGILDSHNFSSLTDQAVGKYRLTLSNNMANTNYCLQGTCRANSRLLAENNDASRAVGYVDVSTVKSWDASHLDVAYNSVLIFGD